MEKAGIKYLDSLGLCSSFENELLLTSKLIDSVFHSKIDWALPTYKELF